MMDIIKTHGGRLWEWFRARAHGPHALGWLVALSILEPIFSPIMPETLMIPMLFAGSTPERWKKYATIVVIFTTVGCAIGFYIGLIFFSTIGAHIIAFYNLEHFFGEAKRLMTAHAFATMFWISFTPIPDKVFVIASGFLGVPFAPFILGSLVGRALRVYLIAYALHRYGERALELMRRYFGVLAIVGVIVIGFLFLELLRP